MNRDASGLTGESVRARDKLNPDLKDSKFWCSHAQIDSAAAERKFPAGTPDGPADRRALVVMSRVQGCPRQERRAPLDPPSIGARRSSCGFSGAVGCVHVPRAKAADGLLRPHLCDGLEALDVDVLVTFSPSLSVSGSVCVIRRASRLRSVAYTRAGRDRRSGFHSELPWIVTTAMSGGGRPTSLLCGAALLAAVVRTPRSRAFWFLLWNLVDG
jgi:hypothetical protein